MSKELKERMVADMKLAGLSKGTQEAYLGTVNAFVRYTWLAPEAAEEKDLEDFLRHLCETGAAKGTFKPARHGLQFLFQNTLRREWSLFEKNSVRPSKNGSRKR